MPAGPPPAPGGAAGYVGPGTLPPAPQNGMGIAALVLGIIGVLGCCTFIFSILAIIFGWLGMKRANDGLATNKGMAMAGMILGIVGVVFSVIYWILIVTGNGSFDFST